MIDSSKKKRRRKYYLLLYYNEAVLQSKLIRLPKVRNGECSATTVTSLDGCIFDTFVCHTYQMALSKYAFGMLLLLLYYITTRYIICCTIKQVTEKMLIRQ